MIRTLLIGASALALSVGVANAQVGTPPGGDTNGIVPALLGHNDSNVEQNENNNRADVDQTGGSLNSAQVKQGLAGVAGSGNNRATVDQNGPGANTAYIEQVGTSRSNLSYNPGGAFSGPSGLPTAGGYEQVATINQTNVSPTGLANKAAIRQGGPDIGGLNNSATINQDGKGNEAFIQQGALGAGYTYDTEEDGRMLGTITQNGFRNIAETQQGEIDSSSTIQNGNNNEAYVRQSATINPGGDDKLGRVSTASQDGNFNFATVLQDANFASSAVSQTGISNNTDVKQYGVSAKSNVLQNGDSNIADVTQRSNASSDVRQGSNFSYAAASDPSAVLPATSTGNRATVNQNAGSADSIVELAQNGTNNRATVTQSGANGRNYVDTRGVSNTVTSTQSGSHNVSSIVQRTIYSGIGSTANNVATQTQTGNNTFGYIAQDGSQNTAVVTLAGNGDKTTIRNTRAAYRDSDYPESQVWQVGSRNSALVTQRANSADSLIYQGFDRQSGLNVNVGTSNLAVVTQLSGATNASSNVYQGGSRNLATVTQLGVDAKSNVDQLGQRNTATVIQSGLRAESAVLQDGNLNVATVLQGAVDVDSIVKQAGNGNFALVSQTVQGMSNSLVTQNGNGNIANISQ